MGRKSKDSDRENRGSGGAKKDEGTHRKSNQGRNSGSRGRGGNNGWFLTSKWKSQV